MASVHILQIIYSLEEGQELANFKLNTRQFKSKQSLIEFATTALQLKYSFLREGWKEKTILGGGLSEEYFVAPKIHKLSCCIILSKDKKPFTPPSWYHQCNGKIWFGDLHPNEPNPYE